MSSNCNTPRMAAVNGKLTERDLDAAQAENAVERAQRMRRSYIAKTVAMASRPHYSLGHLHDLQTKDLRSEREFVLNVAPTPAEACSEIGAEQAPHMPRRRAPEGAGILVYGLMVGLSIWVLIAVFGRFFH